MAGDGGILKIARRIWEVGVAGSPVIGSQRGGAFSTLLRRPAGLSASSDGVLATKSERKMLASTCLYSLYAWFDTVFLSNWPFCACIYFETWLSSFRFNLTIAFLFSSTMSLYGDRIIRLKRDVPDE